MVSPVIHALEQAMYTGSSTKGFYWAFRHPNDDAPPQTFRLCRRDRNGWALLLAASKSTKEVFAFLSETEDDRKAVQEGLRWLGINGQIEEGSEALVLKLTNGTAIASARGGGEGKKKA